MFVLAIMFHAEMEPPEFEACLADPVRRGHAAELAKGLQQLMASYSGLMEGASSWQGTLEARLPPCCHNKQSVVMSRLHSHMRVRMQTGAYPLRPDTCSAAAWCWAALGGHKPAGRLDSRAGRGVPPAGHGWQRLTWRACMVCMHVRRARCGIP